MGNDDKILTHIPVTCLSLYVFCFPLVCIVSLNVAYPVTCCLAFFFFFCVCYILILRLCIFGSLCHCCVIQIDKYPFLLAVSFPLCYHVFCLILMFALHSLDYYMPSSNTGLDIMHLLHLGVNKHAFRLLIVPLFADIGCELDRRMRELSKHFPSTIGRFPTGITEYWSSFKAIQWKNAFRFFLPIALRGLVPSSQYDCLLTLSRVNTLYDQDPITTAMLRDAQSAYRRFYNNLVALCGNGSVAYIVHAFLHMATVCRSLGHPRGFHLYGNERDIGFLQGFRLSGKGSMEAQLAL